MALSSPRPAAPPEQWLAAFIALVEQRFGHTIPQRRAPAFWRAVLEACLSCGEASLERYYARLASEPLDAPAVTELVSRFTIKESYFFRDEHLITVLREVVLPALIEKSGGRPLAIWSAGCSLGEEAYTLSILLGEAAAAHEGLQFSIVATDVDEAGLQKARAAEYGEWSVRSLADDARERYFEKRGNRFVLRPRWRRHVRFETQNLVDASAPVPSPGTFDLVLCRNVAIYFSDVALETLSDKLAQAVGPRGLLLLAPSDPRPSDRCELGPLVIRHGGRAAIGYARPGSSWYGAHGSPQRTAAREPVSPEPSAAPPPVLEAAPAESLPAGAPPALLPSPEPSAAELQARASARLESAYAEAAGGNLQGALAAARSAIELAPLHAEAYFALALFELESGRHDAAETALRRTLYLKPDLGDAHYRLGLLCLRRGDLGSARRAFFNALRASEAHDGSPALAAAIGAQLAHLEKAR